MSCGRRHGGFTLIEILVTLFILAIGLLGLAGMQALAQKTELESYQRAQALILPAANPVGFTNRGQIASFAQRNRLPSMYAQKEYVDAGGLMSYGPSLLDMARRAAIYVDKILKGAKPAELPVEQPTKFELVINLKTAKALGLTIPQSLLRRADQVIQ